MGGVTPVKRRRERRFYLGLALLGVGLLLLVGSGAYFGYASLARSQLDRLVVDARISSEDTASPEAALAAVTQALDSLQDPASSTTQTVPSDIALGEIALSPGGSDLPQHRPLYPGEQLLSKYWADPLRATPPDPYVQRLVQGFQPVNGSGAPSLGKTPSHATRILIPSIQVDARTNELAILDLGDSRAYETPNKVVGHIPDTANPGHKGNGWYFGHLESPLRGEGNVFQNLPKIPELLRQGDEVPVILETSESQYLYRVIKSDVVEAGRLHLYDTDDSTITLVACVPRLVYDHRLLVTAELVGVRPLTLPFPE